MPAGPALKFSDVGTTDGTASDAGSTVTPESGMASWGRPGAFVARRSVSTCVPIALRR